jgi:hypothetical protein
MILHKHTFNKKHSNVTKTYHKALKCPAFSREIPGISGISQEFTKEIPIKIIV